MHVYHNDYEWYVAESREQLYRLYADDCGCEVGVDYDAEDWHECNLDHFFTIRDEDGKNPQTLMLSEWAATNGIGFLATTEC